MKSRIGERGERKRKGGGKYGARCCDDDDGDNGVGGGTGRKREISIISTGRADVGGKMS